MEGKKMNIGVIVYSHSGHTYKAALELQKTLSDAGYQVSLEQLETLGPVQVNSDDFILKAKPSLADYDAVVFCSPVHGGVPAKPLLRYLDQVASLKGKQAAGLVTHFFPRKWGADQTLAALKDISESKGARYCASGDVRWFGFARGKQMKQAVKAIQRTLD